MKKIAIIPARAGSKRIPRKNIRDFHGKPIIAYSIETAIKSNIFDEIMVSTDDEEIASISKDYGAKVPFMRSSENSDDFSTTYNVLEEVLTEYKKINLVFEIGCCIYPSAPLITKEFLELGLAKIIDDKLNTVFPVIEYSHPIQRALFFDKKNHLKYVYPEESIRRTQDFEKKFHGSGQFYWFNVENLLKNKKLDSNKTSGFVISRNLVQDIDTIEDWEIAEKKYKNKI